MKAEASRIPNALIDEARTTFASLPTAAATPVVWKPDLLGRSLEDLTDLVSLPESKKTGFVSLNDALGTATPQGRLVQGRLVCTLFAALAEFERDVIRQPPRAGPAAARATGRKSSTSERVIQRSTRQSPGCQNIVGTKNRTADQTVTIPAYLPGCLLPVRKQPY